MVLTASGCLAADVAFGVCTPQQWNLTKMKEYDP